MQQLKEELSELDHQVDQLDQQLDTEMKNALAPAPAVEAPEAPEAPEASESQEFTEVKAEEGDAELRDAIRKIEASCPNSQSFQLWSPELIKSFAHGHGPIDLDDSDDDVIVDRKAVPNLILVHGFPHQWKQQMKQ